MIKEYLTSRFKLGKLYNSVLINGPDEGRMLLDVEYFVTSKLLGNSILLANHPDYLLIKKEETSKNISIDQIRFLQEFINKTSSISNFKVAIIYSAHLMSLNAANSCLKILEDTPKNSHIFLITSRVGNILTTIRSRSAQLNIQSYNYKMEDDLYDRLTDIFANGQNYEKILAFLKEFTEKNRTLWSDIVQKTIYLFSKIVKKSARIDVELNDAERTIFSKLYHNNTLALIEKFNKIKLLANNTIDYDLDLKSSFILLVDSITSSS